MVPKRSGCCTLSDKIDFKIKTVTKDREWHSIMMRRSIHKEDITIINMHASNNRYMNAKYMKQKLKE